MTFGIRDSETWRFTIGSDSLSGIINSVGRLGSKTLNLPDTDMRTYMNNKSKQFFGKDLVIDRWKPANGMALRTRSNGQHNASWSLIALIQSVGL